MKVAHAVLALIERYPDMGTVEIAARVGCRREYVRVCKQRAGMAIGKVGRHTSWNEARLNRLMILRNKGVSWEAISDDLGHTASACRTRYHLIRRDSGETNLRLAIPDQCLDDRLHRRNLEPRDLTAAFFGDPLPGYSALERRA